MNRLNELLKSIRFELFTVRESALNSTQNLPTKNVYENGDEKSEDKNLNDATATGLADIAIFGIK